MCKILFLDQVLSNSKVFKFDVSCTEACRVREKWKQYDWQNLSLLFLYRSLFSRKPKEPKALSHNATGWRLFGKTPTREDDHTADPTSTVSTQQVCTLNTLTSSILSSSWAEGWCFSDLVHFLYGRQKESDSFLSSFLRLDFLFFTYGELWQLNIIYIKL